MKNKPIRIAGLGLAGLAILAGLWAMQTKQVSLSWDPMPAGEAWQTIRIYDAGLMVAETKCTQTEGTWSCPTTVTFELTKTAHSFTARSFDGNWESSDSNVVTVKGPPAAPGNLKR